jgi:flavin reductase (DIM6/NTAB) family NADH-FMN oxidoreductase RutF
MAELDYDQIEKAFRLVNREVWIVTAADGRRRGGLTATWVSQASIDRHAPAVLLAIAPNHFTAELIDARKAFAVHLLRMDQSELALNFALGSGRTRDKLAGAPITTATTRSPILCDCLAYLDCRVFARLDCGDRIYYWADVLAGRVLRDEQPLTERDLMTAATDEQRQQLLANRDDDVQVQHSLRRMWRQDMPDYLARGTSRPDGETTVGEAVKTNVKLSPGQSYGDLSASDQDASRRQPGPYRQQADE